MICFIFSCKILDVWRLAWPNLVWPLYRKAESKCILAWFVAWSTFGRYRINICFGFEERQQSTLQWNWTLDRWMYTNKSREQSILNSVDNLLRKSRGMFYHWSVLAWQCVSLFWFSIIYDFFFRFGLVGDSFSFFSTLVWFGLLRPRRQAVCAEKKWMTMGWGFMLPRWQECQRREFLLPRRKTMCIEKRKDDDGWGFLLQGIRSRYIVLINHSFICVQVVYLFCFNILICWPAFLDLIYGPVKLTCLPRSYLRAGKADVGRV